VPPGPPAPTPTSRSLEDVPQTWPPSPDEGGPQVQTFPVFPLPRLWLFPGVILPLHVFEPRYRQMVEDSLDGPGRIVLGTVVDGYEDRLAGAPPIYPVAGLGEIGRHDKLDDWRFHVLLVGLQRVRVREVDSERLYRQVEAEPITEVPAPPDEESDLRERVVEAIEARTDESPELPPDLPLQHAVDLLTLRLDLPVAQMNTLYAEHDVKQRAVRALAEHRRRPLPPPGDS